MGMLRLSMEVECKDIKNKRGVKMEREAQGAMEKARTCNTAEHRTYGKLCTIYFRRYCANLEQAGFKTKEQSNLTHLKPTKTVFKPKAAVSGS